MRLAENGFFLEIAINFFELVGIGDVLALKGNTYQGKLNYSMAGPWNIVVKIVRGGKTSSTKFSVDVQ